MGKTANRYRIGEEVAVLSTQERGWVVGTTSIADAVRCLDELEAKVELGSALMTGEDLHVLQNVCVRFGSEYRWYYSTELKKLRSRDRNARRHES